MNAWKKLKSDIVHQNPFWIYRQDVFEIPGGEKCDYYYAETSGSVMVAPLLPDGRLALIRTYRCLFNRDSIEFPGGAVNPDQTFEQAARAELEEEIGLIAQELINIAEFCPWNAVTTEVCKVFLARGLRETKKQNNPQEPSELVLRRIDEMDDLVRRNEIWDGQTLAVWAMVRPHLLRGT